MNPSQIELFSQERNSPAQDKPPQKGARKNPEYHDSCGNVISVGASYAQSGKNGGKGENGHGVGEREKERGSEYRDETLPVRQGHRVWRAGPERLQTEVTEKQSTDQAKPRLLMDQEI